MTEISSRKIQWINIVPIFKNGVILKQLLLAIGIPFGLVIFFILVLSGNSRDSIYAVGLIISTFVLTYVFIKLVYGGKYEAEFTIDEKGVQCRSEEKQDKKNRIVNTLTVMAGFLSQKPAISGAGIMANVKSNIFIPWDKIKTVNYIDKENVIIVKGNLTENIALFCTRENYLEVKEVIRGKIHV